MLFQSHHKQSGAHWAVWSLRLFCIQSMFKTSKWSYSAVQILTCIRFVLFFSPKPFMIIYYITLAESMYNSVRLWFMLHPLTDAATARCTTHPNNFYAQLNMKLSIICLIELQTCNEYYLLTSCVRTWTSSTFLKQDLMISFAL